MTTPAPAAPRPLEVDSRGSLELDLPATFGKYFLTEKLATGGMAEIYLGKLVGPGGFEKPLVIKQIHPRLTGQRQFVDLFVAEAKTLVSLAHGNIVPVYELGVIDDTYFIAMDYIDGPTLYRLTETLRRRAVAMEPAVAAWIAARILEGLDYAHRKGDGVIHRDLSPRNVMLSRDGEVKLVDFGIAVTLGSGGDDDDAGQSAPTGSFPYMSPEQVKKQPLTVQTDLFSVGTLCWEMLVGHRLFARSDPDETLRAVVDEPIARPSSQNPAVPAKLDDVVMRALERDVTARWPSAGDMLAALQRYLYSLDETPGPREIGALVAKYCPPETRRLPTHHDHDSELPSTATRSRPSPRTPGAIGPITPSHDAARVEPPVPPAGPTTAVIPRPRGKRARTETFATHVALEKMLEGAAPNGAPASSVAVPSSSAMSAPSPASLPTAASASPPSPPIAPTLQLPGHRAPSRGLLVLAALGALGLAAGSIFVFFDRRTAIEQQTTPRPRAAHSGSASRVPAPNESPAAITVDASVPTDASIDASTDASVDASTNTVEPARPPDDPQRPKPVRPGGNPPPRPTGEPAPRPAGDPAQRPAGTGRLTIGANPWGNVLLDGKPIGRTPIEQLAVPAGRHVVEVVFGGEDPPRTLRYTIDVANGETRDVLADFTKP